MQIVNHPQLSTNATKWVALTFAEENASRYFGMQIKEHFTTVLMKL